MKKNILQAVSGGFDSTYLMVSNLQNGDNVYPLYIHSKNVNSIKQHIEIMNVRNIIQKLQNSNQNLHDLLETHIEKENIRDLFSMQPILWMLGLFTEVQNNQNCVDYDEVQIGYIMHDTAISFISEIQMFWQSLFKFSYNERKPPKLIFPLTKIAKDMVLHRLRGFDYSILYSCWTCEDPRIIQKKKTNEHSIQLIIEPCGNCRPCSHIKSNEILPFTNLKKYKAIINTDDILKNTEATIKELINEAGLIHIPSKFISLEELDAKTIKRLSKGSMKEGAKERKPPMVVGYI